MPAREARTPLSSSTIRMDSRIGTSRGQVHHEARPPRLVVLDPDHPVVLLDDPADDRETQPAPPPLGREVGNEEAVPVAEADPGPVVGHGEPGSALRAVEPRGDDDPAP